MKYFENDLYTNGWAIGEPDNEIQTKDLKADSCINYPQEECNSKCAYISSNGFNDQGCDYKLKFICGGYIQDTIIINIDNVNIDDSFDEESVENIVIASIASDIGLSTDIITVVSTNTQDDEWSVTLGVFDALPDDVKINNTQLAGDLADLDPDTFEGAEISTEVTGSDAIVIKKNSNSNDYLLYLIAGMLGTEILL